MQGGGVKGQGQKEGWWLPREICRLHIAYTKVVHPYQLTNFLSLSSLKSEEWGFGILHFTFYILDFKC